jgi:D-alanyl-lipoteichoic acid acyltransferase DltB (MBOAT superfamily)
MNFDSYTFLVFWLVVLALYRLPGSWSGQKNVLLAASYAFYAAWNPPFIVLLWISTGVDWHAARKMAVAASMRGRKAWLAVSLLTNLGLLAYFKYSDFVLDNLQQLLASFGLQVQFPEQNLILPIGISFYTFQTLSYTIDVYRGHLKPWPSFRDFALFVSFFPQLVAGPIVRARSLLPQFVRAPRAGGDALALGTALIVLGLFQKSVLADSVFAPVADRLFGLEALDAGQAWLASLAFAGQIFCDFAGYSTIAIGVARSLGFRIPVNFNAPYTAVGFSDFWRRWHISLSRWLRDYLYISLGGNRGGQLRTLRNLLLTMLLGGLWHGAAWTFVAWGALHGLYLVLERLTVARLSPALRASWVFQWIYGLITLAGVLLAWVLFRAQSLQQAADMFRVMLDPRRWTVTGMEGADQLALGVFVLLLIAQLGFRRHRQEAWLMRLPWPLVGLGLALMMAAILLSPSPSRAFIYFQF